MPNTPGPRIRYGLDESAKTKCERFPPVKSRANWLKPESLHCSLKARRDGAVANGIWPAR